MLKRIKIQSMGETSEIENEFIFTWKIKNYYSWFDKNPVCLNSPIFTSEYLNYTKWYLSLCHNVMGFEDYISCWLTRTQTDVDVQQLNVDFKLQIIGTDDKQLFSGQNTNFLFTNGTRFNLVNGIKNKSVEVKEVSIEDTLTIKLHMIKSDSSFVPKTECVAVTKFSVDRFLFNWKIEKPSSTNWSKIEHFYCSPSKLFEMAFIVARNETKITIQKRNGNAINDACLVYCKLSLLNSDGFVRVSKKDTHVFKDSIEKWEFPAFINVSNPIDEISKHVVNNAFTLRCELLVSNKHYSSEIRYVLRDLLMLKNDENVSVGSLQKDFRSLYINGVLHDVKLRIDKDIFFAHKCVLSARSPVFHAMFDQQQMLENQTGIVDITDVDSNILALFLEYVYTGNVDNMNYENAAKLLIVADKYQVLSLWDKCSRFLKHSLSEKNVLELLIIADMIQHNILKKSALDYIKAHAAKVLSTVDWFKCIEKNAKLATEVLTFLSPDSGITNDLSFQ